MTMYRHITVSLSTNVTIPVAKNRKTTIKVFFLNNQPDALIIQIYSVIKHVEFYDRINLDN